ncbi:MAG: ATP-dependent protease subunit HslV [Christensenellales bacterium]
MSIKGTTIIAVKRDGKIVLAGDGQVTAGERYILKGNAVKVRRIYDDKVVVGFAGTTADAFTLTEKFEKMLKKYSGNLIRASVELAQLWRGDKGLRELQAQMIVADKDNMYLLTGNGDVIEPENDVIEIGSGGPYAKASALALLNNTKLSARDIAVKSIEIAGSMCVFTNGHITVEEV